MNQLQQHLHIIALDVPYPVDYGGVYDLFYKLPALHERGVEVHLHCFDNGRGVQPELDQYCASVNYYPRKTGWKGVASNLPYIVSGRKNETLHRNLLKDDHPILMEGVHCSYPVFDKRFDGRKKWVRLHNVEHLYYRKLWQYASNDPIKKIYYAAESRLLKRYEAALAKKKVAFLAVTEKDAHYYRNQLEAETVDYLPLFLPPWQVNASAGSGNYCLYHGNLGVKENEFAAVWLLQHVVGAAAMQFIIAGRSPSSFLRTKAEAKPNVRLIADPSANEMDQLIREAQVHVLPSFNNTGIKLKLLNALYNGRHCVTNTNAIDGTELGQLCTIAEDEAQLIAAIQQLGGTAFEQADVIKRQNILHHHFDNGANAAKLIAMIWGTGT